MENMLQGMVIKVKLPEQFGFIKPSHPLPRPYNNKDVHFPFRVYNSDGIISPQQGEEVKFALAPNTYEKPAAHVVYPANRVPRERSHASRASHSRASQSARNRSTSRGLTASGRRSASACKNEQFQGDTLNTDSSSSSRSESPEVESSTRGGLATTRRVPGAHTALPPQQTVLNKQGQQSSNLPFQGRVITMRDVDGFIRPDVPLPLDYNQSKDVYFYANKVQAGHLRLMPGDKVGFTLGTKDKERPMAPVVKLIKCAQRGREILSEYISQVLKEVSDIISKGSKDPEGSVYIRCAVSCQVVWECIGCCTTYDDGSIRDLIDLLLKLEKQSSGIKTLFSKLLRTLCQTPFLNPHQGCLKDFILRSYRETGQGNCLALQMFLLMLMQNVPEKTRVLANLVKPLVDADTCSVESLLYSMLKNAVRQPNSNVNEMEWDELPLIPTTDELLTGPLEGEENLRPVLTKGSYTSAEDYLDIYFRLLREDCFGGVKKGVRELLDGKLNPRDMNVYLNVQLVGIQLTRQDSGLALGLKVTPQRKIRSWKTCSNLMFGNLLCISPNATFRDALWATVVNRSALETDQVVAVELCTEHNAVGNSEAVLLLEAMNGRIIMVESPTYYRAYQPVLKALQKVCPQSLPFQEELITVRKERFAPKFLQSDPEATLNSGIIYSDSLQMNVQAFAHNLGHGTPGTAQLDRSQELAVKQALLHRVAIIQGPPGTGKTYVGVKLVQLLQSMSCSQEAPMLLLTYKNHALDEFLKGLLNVGITKVVRVGGRSQDSLLEKYNLHELKRAKHTALPWMLFMEMRECRMDLDAMQVRVKEAFKKLDRARFLRDNVLIEALSSEQLRSLLQDCDWSKTGLKTASGKPVNKTLVKRILSEVPEALGDYLRTADSNDNLSILFREAARLWKPDPSAIKKVEEQMMMQMKRATAEQLFTFSKMKKSFSDEELYNEDDIEDEQREREAALGRQQMGKGEELMEQFTLLKQDETGGHKLFGVTKEAVVHAPIQILTNVADVWSLEPENRVRIIQAILLRQYEEVAETFDQLLAEYESLCAQKNELEMQSSVEMLGGGTVVGMTITGASLHHQLLEQVQPAVVIVEEAAEVLEPQLIALLGPWVQHLILIGDHKQLRPQVESFVLKRDYKFDVSLMERLINNGLPYSTLAMQNRMRPEFADLLLDIYPRLQSNLARVSQNAAASCIEHSMFFWDHQHEEISGRSYSNEEEARRAVQLALFLIQQGYRPSQITILAAYQGQVALIRKLVLKAKDVHRDIFNCVNQPSGDMKHQTDELHDNRRVEVQTIDMYQGDENDFVIVSLVRSNSRKTTGFVKSLNRRCVAQSRAKCGVYFIGDYQTIFSAGNWQCMLKKMKEEDLVGPVMPLHCAKHPETKLQVREAKDINLRPFCHVICNALMPCKEHRCQKRCQPKHSHEVCKEEVKFAFACGHPGTRKCYISQNTLLCKQEVSFLFRNCGHPGSRVCHVPEEKMTCVADVNFHYSECGHPGTRKCYIAETDLVCDTKIGFTYAKCGHPGSRKCRESPGLCRKKVRVQLPCSHKAVQECWKDPKSIVCEEPCLKKLPCSHRCPRKCYQACDLDCSELVVFHYPVCRHLDLKKCNVPEATLKCEKKIVKQLPCGHTGLQECSEEPENFKCGKPCDRKLFCLHPCPGMCYERCETKQCKVCEDIRQEEEKLMQKRHEEHIEKLRKEAQSQIEELKKSEKGKCQMELLPSGDTASEYYDVEDKVKKYIQPGHNWFPIITKIEKVSNPELEVNWLRMKMKVKDPAHVARKFHGTTAEAAEAILTNGFRIPAPKNQMFGPGIYFATDSSKSAQDIYTKGSGVLLLCDVLLGRTKTVERAQNHMTGAKLAKLGYDSLFAKRGTRDTGGVLYDEFVVYNSEQALPLYRIHYRKADVAADDVASHLDELEKQVLASSDALVCHNISWKREMKYKDNLEIHFRIAESQVLRHLTGSTQKVKSVDYYINPPLVRKFNAKAKEFAMKYGSNKEADFILAFHGTKPENIKSIVKQNFLLNQLSKNTGNQGYYGAGIYFSEFPAVSLGYGQAVLLCRVLPGKSYDCPGLMMGASLKPGFDSHRSQKDTEGRGQELVIFNPDQILPCYVINI